MSGAATLAEAREQHFQDEYQRLLRALFESIDKESGLLREIRQMKEALVSVALRLQVAHQINQMDEVTMLELRKEVSDARMAAHNANKQFAEATDVITSLKREIGSLKRQLRDVRNMDLPDPNAPPRLADPSANAAAAAVALPTKDHGAAINLGGQGSFGQAADREVDQLMSVPLYKPTLGPGGKPLHSPLKTSTTPFQEWKMQSYLYTPDTLEGSRNHDPLVVQLLHAAASRASLGGAGAAGIDNSLSGRSTKSIIAKARAPESKAEAEARELAASLEGLNLPAMTQKMKKAREKGAKNIWGLAPPERLLSRDPLALRRVGSPVKGGGEGGGGGGGGGGQRADSSGSVTV